MDKIVKNILDYSKELVGQKVTSVGDCISVRNNDYMYITDINVNISELKEENIYKIKIDEANGKYKLFADIYKTREDIRSICHCHPLWVNPISETGKKIPAVTDDMTQIIGLDCKTVNNNDLDIIKNLKKRNSILVKNDGCITTGRTLNESYTCVLVLDKAAHCFVGASVLQKNKLINFFEAKLMNFIYKIKYSKKNQENLQNEEAN